MDIFAYQEHHGRGPHEGQAVVTNFAVAPAAIKPRGRGKQETRSLSKALGTKDLGPDFIEALSLAHADRRFAEGVAMLDRAETAMLALSPSQPHAAELLLLIAQWVDVGYKDHDLLERLLAKFPPELRRELPLNDYLRIRMVEAFHALSTNSLDTAIDILSFVLKVEQEFSDQRLVALAHFWKGRAHRKKGEYELALRDIVAARSLAEQFSEGKAFAAVIQIQESWLLFQDGKRKEAWRLLDEAESALESTDYYVALGNIESARGRIVRRAGEYAKALEHFHRAIAIYAGGDSTHVNLARTLVNAAYVKRLLALQLRKRIDAKTLKPRSSSHGDLSRTQARHQGNLRSRYLQICHEAILLLQQAREIYTRRSQISGIGSVILNTGYLHMDKGDIDGAALEAMEAYRLGHEQNDHILMARARIMQASIENTRIDEQLAEEEDIAIHAETAKKYCEEALEMAHHTQNRRLLASAYIASGMTACNDFFQEWELAKQRAGEATGLLEAGDSDSLLHDLVSLKTRIMQASGINDVLRGWSEGMTGDKTFQQISEEFAELVIPKVWLREGKIVSRVAQRLSISPKKVRRVLKNTGYLQAE
jgi:tetratricopeptide (TPR) repeat protein